MLTEISSFIFDMAPLILPFAYVLSWLMTFDLVFLFFATGMILNNFIINHIIKLALFFIFKDNEFIYAPKNAEKQCTNILLQMFSKPSPECRQVTMPSFLAQTAGFFMTSGVLYVIDNKRAYVHFVFALLTYILYAVGMLIYDMLMGCHTIYQIFTGFVIGSIVGGLWFLIYYFSSDGFKTYTF